MDADHLQVPVLDFQCDEEFAELITLMNQCGIQTLLSCQIASGSVARPGVYE